MITTYKVQWFHGYPERRWYRNEAGIKVVVKEVLWVTDQLSD
jgi:hypothetical protein